MSACVPLTTNHSELEPSGAAAIAGSTSVVPPEGAGASDEDTGKPDTLTCAPAAAGSASTAAATATAAAHRNFRCLKLVRCITCMSPYPRVAALPCPSATCNAISTFKVESSYEVPPSSIKPPANPNVAARRAAGGPRRNAACSGSRKRAQSQAEPAGADLSRDRRQHRVAYGSAVVSWALDERRGDGGLHPAAGVPAVHEPDHAERRRSVRTPRRRHLCRRGLLERRDLPDHAPVPRACLRPRDPQRCVASVTCRSRVRDRQQRDPERQRGRSRSADGTQPGRGG